MGGGGGGGGGGVFAHLQEGGGGGKGGQYCKSTVAVTPGEDLRLFVGEKGFGGVSEASNAGTNGLESYVQHFSFVDDGKGGGDFEWLAFIFACGGNGAPGGMSGGFGSTTYKDASLSLGDVIVESQDGASYTADPGHAGIGGSGGNSAIGLDGELGIGGAGAPADASGGAASTPGGGGGGGGGASFGAISTLGGNGGNGFIRIRYTPAA
jgi:hypothetical protein